MATNRTITKKDHTFASSVGREIPMAFGANFNDDPICRNTLRKSHTLGRTELQHVVPEEDVANFVPYQQYDFSAGASTMITASQVWGAGVTGAHLQATQRSQTGGAIQPPVAVDETVLRFLGYFIEPVLESASESTRVRKVAVLFHCADESILVREAIQVNSGINQGIMLKRQRVPLSEDPASWIKVDALNIGATLNIFGKKITLVDATEATKKYLRDVVGRRDVPNEALPWPVEQDTYNTTVGEKLTTRPRRLLPTADYDHKRANEAMRGSGVISKHSPADVRTAQQFFRNRINEHLQFAAYWDDRAKKSGDLRLVVIRYFLENDTVEIVEQRDDNSGREGAAKLLCRQRVSHPDVPHPQLHEAQQNTYGLLLKDNYLTFDDLTVGVTINIEGRPYFTYDADSFTRAWYKANRNVTLPDPVDISEVIARSQRVVPVQYPPPHNGWGSEEDSIRSCKSLLLKPPPLDTAKLARENGKVMVFEATLFNPTQPEDVGREFVVSFHRANDHVEITERQLRNSGIVGGKFLAKGRHLKSLPDGRRVPYTPDDFVVGQIVRLVGRDFLLKEMDERSRKLVDGEFDKVTEDRIKQLVVAFRELLNTKYFRAHEAFRAVAPDGALTAKQLMEFFSKSAGDITVDEANHLIHYFSQGQGAIPYERFIRIMDPGNTNNLDEAANSIRSVKSVEVFDRETEEGLTKATKLAAITSAAEDAAAVQRLKRQFAEKLVQRRGTIQESFRMLSGHVLNARLTYDALRTALAGALRIKMDAREEKLLLASIFDTEAKMANGIDFKTFHEYVESV